MTESLFVADDRAQRMHALRKSRGGGFDCILGNPPWERVKLQEKEWFAERVPEIANAPNASARGKMIKALEKERPELFTEFLADVRAAEAASAFMRGSGRFPLCGRGDVNLYTVFAESMRDGVSPIGRVGCIVPSGVATDDTTKFFFQDLVDRASLASLFDFENAAPIFEGVHRSYKFSCLTLRAPAPDAKTAALAPAAEFVFFAHKVEDLADERRRFTLTRDEIALVNPNTKTCPIFRTKVDAELTKYIYRRVPVLVKEATDTTPEENPWGVEFSTMFHMSNDSGLFRTREQLEKDGWRLRGNVFERGADKYLPLYEAKMVDFFDHRAASVVLSATAQIRQGQPEAISAAEHSDATKVPFPRSWVAATEVEMRLRIVPSFLIGIRDITSATNERTVIAAAIPVSAVGNNLPLVLCAAPNSELLLSCLNAFAVDFTARFKVGGLHLNFFIVEQFVIATPDWFDSGGSSNSPWRKFISLRTLELSATADDMSPFSRDLWPEGDGAVFRYDPERRFEIRCELDAAFFHLYLGTANDWRAKTSPELLKALPTPRDAVAYIMETFPIVKKKDIAAHGVYRTKERIIALYDQLQSCLATNTPFVSALTPPPGPPTNADGTFAKLPPWPKGAPRPAAYPIHVHPPLAHRS
ncbi:MAG: hypothetical protein RIR77_47 [Planctomycetota bacterium]|jgi:hypothetical protein